jgi:hypothetical protein
MSKREDPIIIFYSVIGEYGYGDGDKKHEYGD